jgi:2-C-methyl-D-erythritol 4-phosphate cytidylyltransferase
MDTLAILVAAGRGERLGASLPKAFVPVRGQTLLRRSATALAAARSVHALVAVVPEGCVERAREDLAGVPRLLAVVEGGARRQDSVLEGLKQAPDDFAGVVLVHDAARPFVDPAIVDEAAAAAAAVGAAIPVVAIADTVKRVVGGRVAQTLDRSELFAAQTPQAVRFDLLGRALEEAFRDGVTVTDEAAAVERLGEPVAVVDGHPRNRKITTPDDLAWAERMLQEEA